MQTKIHWQFLDSAFKMITHMISYQNFWIYKTFILDYSSTIICLEMNGLILSPRIQLMSSTGRHANQARSNDVAHWPKLTHVLRVFLRIGVRYRCEYNGRRLQSHERRVSRSYGLLVLGLEPASGAIDYGRLQMHVNGGIGVLYSWQ